MFTGTTTLTVAEAIPDDGKVQSRCEVNSNVTQIMSSINFQQVLERIEAPRSGMEHRNPRSDSRSQVYALDIEDYMKEFTTPYLRRAGVLDKV